MHKAQGLLKCSVIRSKAYRQHHFSSWMLQVSMSLAQYITTTCVFLWTIVIAVSQAAFGQGTGPVFLSNVRCTGNDYSLLSCNHSEIGVTYCSHYYDAGVVCPSCKWSSSSYLQTSELFIRLSTKLRPWCYTEAKLCTYTVTLLGSEQYIMSCLLSRIMEEAPLKHRQLHQNSTEVSKCDSTEYAVYTLPLIIRMEHIHTSPL